MAAKNRSITVMDCRCGSFELDGQDFRVKLATNFIRYQMDEYISTKSVDKMIKEGIRVSIVPYK